MKLNSLAELESAVKVETTQNYVRTLGVKTETETKELTQAELLQAFETAVVRCEAVPKDGVYELLQAIYGACAVENKKGKIYAAKGAYDIAKCYYGVLGREFPKGKANKDARDEVVQKVENTLVELMQAGVVAYQGAWPSGYGFKTLDYHFRVDTTREAVKKALSATFTSALNVKSKIQKPV